MNDYLGAYIDLLVRKSSNRNNQFTLQRLKETKSKKNVWYRYLKWDSCTQPFLSKETSRVENAHIMGRSVQEESKSFGLRLREILRVRCRMKEEELMRRLKSAEL